jgi:hypothetical protein
MRGKRSGSGEVNHITHELMGKRAMETQFSINSMTRRTFSKVLGLGLGAGATLSRFRSGSAAPLAEAEAKVMIYAFYPIEHGAATHCKACLAHAANKRFATRGAAESNRAHAGCQCSIIMTSVTQTEYQELFGGVASGVDPVADLRWLKTTLQPSA